MNPLLRLLGAAALNGLLTGQIVFSTAFVGVCELPNWIQAPPRGECMPGALDDGQRTVLPLRHAERHRQDPAGPGPRPAGGVPMSRPIPAGDYVEHFDPEIPHHRAWLLAVLEQLVAHELDNRPDKTEFEFSKAM